MSNHASGPPIVAGVDGSMSALHAVRWAAAEAARRSVPLRLVHVQPPVGTGTPDLGQQWLSDADFLARRTAPAVRPDSCVRLGDPATELLAESRTARLIVAGARGAGGFSGLALGSVALALATGGHCPAVIVRGRPTQSGPVVVGVCGTPRCQAVLDHAFDQAESRAEPLLAVHAWHPLPADADIAAAMGIAWTEVEAEQHDLLTEWLSAGVRRRPGVHVTRVIAAARPARALLGHSRFAQLVVVGCRGRSPLTGLVLGSVPRALLHHAPCPVLVVRDGHCR
ncbi:universal stress protein [Kutzneria chonburiensis]|uniref:Universal stress protein n=1 Tax=Kutzneria chonburiensis TaxID=1483604 RepID=A0ABV6MNV8_9PSEU|nr:universal stress protein [Kutzneria chonburiensis]